MPRTAVSHPVCVEGLGVLDFLNETLVSTSKYAAEFSCQRCAEMV